MFSSLTAAPQGEKAIQLQWDYTGPARAFRACWSDRFSDNMRYKPLWQGEERSCQLDLSLHRGWYFQIEAFDENGETLEKSPVFRSQAQKRLKPFLEKLNRGLIAVKTPEGIFLAWRLFKSEVTGHSESGLTGADFIVLKNGKPIATVTDSTNFLDREGTMDDRYSVQAA